jgi:hypothetical protein
MSITSHSNTLSFTNPQDIPGRSFACCMPFSCRARSPAAPVAGAGGILVSSTRTRSMSSVSRGWGVVFVDSGETQRIWACRLNVECGKIKESAICNFCRCLVCVTLGVETELGQLTLGPKMRLGD